jgi:hypothetical protein
MKHVLALLVFCGVTAVASAADEPKEILLPTSQAKIEGKARYDDAPSQKCVRYWDGTNIVLRWSINVPARAAYRVFVTYAAPDGATGNEAEVAVGNQIAKFQLKGSGGWGMFAEQDIGPVLLRTPGPAELSVKITKRKGPAWDFRSVRLVPER